MTNDRWINVIETDIINNKKKHKQLLDTIRGYEMEIFNVERKIKEVLKMISDSEEAIKYLQETK